MKRILSFTFVLLVLATLNPLSAQDQQGSENSLLPEIDPQDIEIRSQFQARFPGLSRQPILGFDPSPRVYQIDPNRMPFMETEEQVVANLPVSELTRPDPPGYMPLHYSSDINAYGRFGVGSYISPEAKFWGVTRINNKSYVGGDFDFSSSDGHLDNQESSFRFFNANAEFATKLNSSSRLAFSGGIDNSFNNMFDLDQSNVPDNARKEYNGFNINGEFESFKNSITGWNVQANVRYFDAALQNAGNISGNSEEMVYNGSVAKRWAGQRVNETFTVKLGAKGGNYDNNTAFTDKWLTTQGGVEYERLFNYSTKLTADASVYYAMDEFSNRVYPAPSLTIEHPLLNILTLTVKGSAEPYFKTVKQLHEQNRFLNVDNALRHSYKIAGSAEASLEYTDLGTLNMGVQYENISDYPVFVRENLGQIVLPGISSSGFYEMIYRDVYKARAYASVSHQLIPERFWLSGKAYVQSPQIKNGGRIPYEEKFGINSSVSIRPFDMLTFEAWADYIGSRTTMRSNSELGGFLLLGGQLDVQISDRFGAYVKLVNLLSQEYEVWQGYTERPFQAYGGVTVKL